jgi:nucleotide-binding universal stress UspA family protein
MYSSAHRSIAPMHIATIGVGYNGSSRSTQALAVGRELAAAHGARIRVMEVVCPARFSNDPHATMTLSGRVDALLIQARERLAGLAGVDSCAVYGIAADELAALGEEVDLLVVGLGSRAARWHSLASASTSEYLQRHAPCPVLVVPRSSRLTCPEPRAPGGRGCWRAVRRARWCER